MFLQFLVLYWSLDFKNYKFTIIYIEIEIFFFLLLDKTDDS